MTTKTKSILTVNETAELCNCHRDTVTSWIHSGKLKAAQPGRLILIRLDDVYEMLEKNQVSA
jgi:excisionase family DNA binding protein